MLPSCCAWGGGAEERRCRGWNRAGVRVELALAPLPRPVPGSLSEDRQDGHPLYRLRRLRLRRQIQGPRLSCPSASLPLQPKLAWPAPSPASSSPLHRACRQPPEPPQSLPPFLVPTLSTAGPGSSALETSPLSSTYSQVPGPGHHPHSLASSCWPSPRACLQGSQGSQWVSPHLYFLPLPALVFRLDGLTLCASLGSKPGSQERLGYPHSLSLGDSVKPELLN